MYFADLVQTFNSFYIL